MKHGYFKNGVVRGSGTYQVSDIDTAQYISDTANKYPSIFKIFSNFEYNNKAKKEFEIDSISIDISEN